MITPAYAMTATERVLPRLALDFTTGALDPRVTVARALNTATRVNASGLIEVVNADLPRFDYSPTTLAPKGLLIEEARTNSLTYSSDLSNGAWNKTNLNTTGTPPYVDVATAPDGTDTADKMIENTATSVQHQALRSFTGTPSATYTVSIFAKAAGRDRMTVFIGGPSYAATFDLANGTVISGAASRIEDYGNGWYRCISTANANAGGAFNTYFQLNDGSSTFYTGDGTSGIYIWGAQLEAGAFATSYIPTTTTSVTRNADAVSMTGTNFSDWFNQSEGAISVEFNKPIAASNSSFVRIWEMSDGTTSNRMRMMLGATTTANYDCTSGSVAAGFMDMGAYSANTNAKMVGAYKTDSFAASQNGASPSTDVSGTISWTLNKLVLGGNATGGGSYLNGYIRKFMFYPQRLINNEVRAFAK